MSENSDCQHDSVYWYDKDGIGGKGITSENADHGRCRKCWAFIPGQDVISLHFIYCDCERCTEVRSSHE